LVRLKVDVIVTQGNIATAAAKQATSTIPIVFGVAGDPVGTGLVASLARPGGNVTGLSLQQPDTSAKRLELLRDVVPKLHKVAILTNADNPVNMRELPDVEAAARKLGLELSIVEIRHGADIAPAFGKIAGSADAVYVLGDTVLFANRTGISTLAASAKLPTISNQPLYATAGGLLSYGPNSADLYRRAAEFVDKILRGAKPADLPVEQPTKFDLVVNQTTAKAIGLKIPESILIRADQVIE
jgi:putative ABC transport system substrate-binding protein